MLGLGVPSLVISEIVTYDARLLLSATKGTSNISYFMVAHKLYSAPNTYRDFIYVS